MLIIILNYCVISHALMISKFLYICRFLIFFFLLPINSIMLQVRVTNGQGGSLNVIEVSSRMIDGINCCVKI